MAGGDLNPYQPPETPSELPPPTNPRLRMFSPEWWRDRLALLGCGVLVFIVAFVTAITIAALQSN